LLFGHPSSPWRSQVIIERKRYLIKNFIINLLLYSLAGERPKILSTHVSNNDAHTNLYGAAPRPKDKEFCVGVQCFKEGQWLVIEPYSQEWLDEGYSDRIRQDNVFDRRVASKLVEELDIQAEQTAPIKISGERLINLFMETMQALIRQDRWLYARSSIRKNWIS